MRKVMTAINGITKSPLFPIFHQSLPTNHKKTEEEFLLSQTLSPPSEKPYTEQDALLNHYLNQNRISIRIEGDNVYGNTKNVCLSLPDMIKEEDLEAYRKVLESQPVHTKEIDWQGVTNDFVQMGVNFNNAEHLNTKIDYITSRYAILQNQIKNQYTGKEQKQQLNLLDSMYESAKQSLVDTYAASIGNFYGELGTLEEKENLTNSLIKGIDSRLEQFQEHLANHESALYSEPQKKQWLLQDDAYMASKLRNSMGSQNKKNESSEYTLHDLEAAGIYAKQTLQQYQSLGFGGPSVDDEEMLGLQLAFQEIKTDYFTQHAQISDSMAGLIKRSYQNYKEAYLDTIDERIAENRLPGQRQSLDRESINEVYNYTIEQYKSTGDTMEAVIAGAKYGQEQYNKKFSQGIRENYLKHYDWNQFFSDSSYGENKKSAINQFTDSWRLFTASLNRSDTGKWNLMLNLSSKNRNSSENNILETYA